MTTGEAIRTFCRECVNGTLRQVAVCGGEKVIVTGHKCQLFEMRLSGRGKLNPIRKNCIECMGGNREAVADCQTETCPLHPFRMGLGSLRERYNKPLAGRFSARVQL